MLVVGPTPILRIPVLPSYTRERPPASYLILPYAAPSTTSIHNGRTEPAHSLAPSRMSHRGHRRLTNQLQCCISRDDYTSMRPPVLTESPLDILTLDLLVGLTASYTSPQRLASAALQRASVFHSSVGSRQQERPGLHLSPSGGMSAPLLSSTIVPRNI